MKLARPLRPLGALLLLVLVAAPQLAAQDERPATVRGFVVDASGGQALPGVNVLVQRDGESPRGAVTNRDGFFLVGQLLPGRYLLRASFVGFATLEDTLVLGAGEMRTVSLRLASTPQELGEIVVETEVAGGGAPVTAGVQTIRPSDLRLVPAADPTGDLGAYLAAMPGVVTTGDRGGQFFIRGGEPGHNLALLDGMPVFQPFHVLGPYSAFSADLLQSAQMHALAVSSRFSGRLHSVIDVRSRNGNDQSYRRTLTLSPFMNQGILEGPVSKGRASFLASARQSVIDRLASKYVDAPLPFAFGDLFGKVHVQLADEHQVSVTALRTYDRGDLSGLETQFWSNAIRWHNTAVGARYVVLPKSLPIFGEIQASGSFLDSQVGPLDDPDRRSRIEAYQLAAHFTNFGAWGEVAWGFFLRYSALDALLGGRYQNIASDKARSSNPGAYFEPDVRVGRRLRFRPGIVVQYYGSSGTSIEPRLRAIFEHGRHRATAAAGIHRQEVVGLYDRRDATSVFAAWTETPLGDTEVAQHVLVGYGFGPLRGVELSVEGYASRLSNLSIAEWTAYPRFTTRLQPATGSAKGADLRFEWREGPHFLMVTYGISSVRYESDQAGLSFRPPHDRRHQVNVLSSTTLAGFDVSVRWQLGSGLPYTRIQGFDRFLLMNGPQDLLNESARPRVIYDRPFGGVLPTYHRLDVSVERVFQYRDDSFVTLQAGVLNVYDRANLFALDLFTLRRVNQLPLVPTAGIKFEF